MKIKRRSFTIGLKVSKDYNSYEVREGVEVELDDDRHLADWHQLKDKVEDNVRKRLQIIIPQQPKNLMGQGDTNG